MKKLILILLCLCFVVIVSLPTLAQKPTAVIKKATAAPIIDGAIDEVWATANVYNIDKSYRTEVPTLGASGETTWQALWTSQGLYILVTVTDDYFYPNYAVTPAGDNWQYDKPELFFDVNYVLADGQGPANGNGHYLVAPVFTDGMNDGTPLTQFGDVVYAFKVEGTNYIGEYFVPFTYLIDKDGFQPDLTNAMGFDIYIIDRDPDDIWRNRAAWANVGAIDENWSNMDDAGLVTFEDAEAPVYVEEITLNTGGTITVDNGTLQMVATIIPENATYKKIKWSIINDTGQASIDNNGLLTAIKNGTVNVEAVSADGMISANVSVVISGQNIDINDVWNGFNLISNWNYDNGLTGWGGWIDGSVAGQVAPVVEDGVVVMKVGTSPDNWHYQHSQNALQAEANVPYILTFKSWASANAPAAVDFEDNVGNNYNRYGASTDPEAIAGRSEWHYNLTTEPTWYIFHVTFDQILPTTNQKVQWMLSLSNETIYLDSILLVKESDYIGFSVDRTMVQLGSSGSSSTVNITGNVDWTVSSDQTWLTVNPSSGTGDGVITFSATENTGVERIAKVKVNSSALSQTITVTQASGLEVSSNTASIEAAAGSKAFVDVIANVAWTASSNQSWLTVSPNEGTGFQTLTFTAEANPSNTSFRSATITVSTPGIPSKTIAVTQAFTVDPTLIDAFELDNSFEFASNILPNETQTHSIYPIGDVDYASFELTDAPARINIKFTTEAGGRQLQLFDSYGNLWGQGWDQISASVTQNGTYYIKAWNPEPNEITLKYDLLLNITPVVPDAFEPDNTIEQASTILPNVTQTHSIYPVGDVDFVSFELTSAPANIEVKSSATSEDIELAIICPDGSGFGTLNQLLTTLTKNGKYYISVRNSNNQLIDNYNLNLTIKPIIIDKYEPDNTWEQATEILPFFEQDDHTIKALGDVDYLKFSITDAPRTVYVDVADTRSDYCNSFGVWLFDTDGTTQLNYNYTQGQRCGYSRLQQTITTNGTYFVKVAVPENEGGMRDNYSIKVTTDGTPPVIACNEGDRAALVAIYNALNGPNWNRQQGWLSDNVMNWQGVTLNPEGRVVKLNLTCNKLRGTIPSEIGNLTALKYLNLGNYWYRYSWNSNNYLYGTSLPTSMANLVNLEVLSLDNLNLGTELPDIFSAMSNLRELYLNNNFFTNAQLPDGILSCTKLERLFIQYNNLSQLPDFTGLANIQQLEAFGNRLTFEDLEPNIAVPNFYYSNQANIGQPLGLNPEADSTITHTIEVGGANNLYQWYKNNQPIQGQTTNTLRIDNVSLSDAGIYQLRVTNTLATQLTLYSEPIILYQKELPIYKALEAFYNSTGGSNWYNKANWLSDAPINTWFGIYQDQYNGQYSLELYNNNLVGELPVSMGDLTLFYGINISSNRQLTGPIPESIGDLKNLSWIGLEDNQLSGTVPTTLTNCNNLRSIYLGYNNLENLPDLSAMSNLNDLFIYNNRFEFDDIEPTRTGKPNLNFNYNPQQKFGQIEVYTKQPGESLTLTTTVGGNGNLYQWYKDGNLVEGKTANTLVFDTLLVTDRGSYVCKVTNPSVPNLTLESESMSIIDASLLDAFEPDNTIAQASTITSGTIQQHSIYPVGDVDYASFELTNAPAEVTVRFMATTGSRQIQVIAPDGTMVLTQDYEYSSLTLSQNGKYYIRAWNPDNQIVDSYQLSLSVRPIVVDKYEPDNTWEQATEILPFFEQDDHTIKAWGDMDYLKFTISDAPRTIYIDVTDTRKNCAEFGLWLYNTDGTTEIKYAQGGANYCGTHMEQFIQENGTYYVKVAVPQNYGGMRENYTIKVTTDGTPPVVACNEEDRAALIAIYNAMNGPNWNHKEGWLTDNVMNWKGVTLNPEGRVVKLNLTRNNLRGTIPSEIGNLTALTYLNLGNDRYVESWDSNNYLSGTTLPTSMSNLVNLEVLSLDVLQFNTQLPDIFSAMSKLRELYLDQNYFTNAQLPDGILSCRKLESLFIQYNNFSQLHNFTDFVYLQDIIAYGNRLTFEDIEPNLSSYNFQYYAQAKIGDPLALNPETGSTESHTIEVGGENNLYQWYKNDQPIPGQTTNTLLIENVSLSDAGIYQLRVTNTLATQFTLYSEPITLYQKELPIYKALEDFYNSTGGPNWYNNTNWLSDVPLTSWFGIYQESNGQYRLDLYNNNLVGQLPANMGDLTLFYDIHIANNRQLKGIIPESIGNLSQIQTLRIYDNGLIGEIPSSIGNLNNLSGLELGYNQLSGSVPATITGCTNLHGLHIQNNRIENIPDLSTLPQWMNVNITNNKFQFDDIEPTLSGKQNIDFYYDPQAKFGQVEVYTKQPGEALTLTANVGGTGNLYQWYKDGNLLEGKTANTLVFDALLVTDRGSYVCKVTNPSVPNLTLESEPMSIIDASLLDAYEPDNTWEQATEILPFFEQDDHTIKLDGDVDYLKFTVTDAPRTVYIDVTDTRKNCTEFGLWLYDTDGTTEIKYAQGGANYCGTHMEQFIQENGTYYVKVAVPQNYGGTRENYTIKVTTDGTPPVVACNEEDQAALIAIYNAMNGPNWNHKEGWLTDNVMNWKGVTLNAQGRVVKLNLTRNNLRGNIPSEIGNLTALRYLNLGNHRFVEYDGSYNNLTGNTLPLSMANLVNLEVLSLDVLQFYTELPDIFSAMSKLRELYLDQNYFTNAQLPYGIINCSKLERLYFQFNNFSQLPNLTSLAKIQEIQAYRNRLTFEDIEPNLALNNFGYFDQANIGQALSLNPEPGSTVLQTIEVGGENNLYQWYKNDQLIEGQTTKTLVIENVSLSDAGIYQLRITNTLATQLTLNSEYIILYQKELPVYKALEAFYNSTGGSNWVNKTNWLSDAPMTSWHGIQQQNGWTSLQLYNNNLAGALPSNIGDLKLFNEIYIGNNRQLTGSIPESIGNLSQIQTLYMYSNGLTGEIPASIGNLKNLSDLDLEDNQLTGSVPATITDCSNLRYIHLGNNKLEYLTDLSGMSNLNNLNIYNNRFEFDDIEPTRTGKPNLNFNYNPQQKFGQVEIYNKQPGEALTLTATVGGNSNLYQWYKDGNLLEGKTDNTLVFDALLITDRGSYVCKVTNTSVPDLTLESEPMSIIDASLLDAYEPDNSIAQASIIAPNVLQQHNIYPVGDVDYASFELTQAPAEVTVRFMATTGSRQIQVIAPDGTTVLTQDYEYSSLTLPQNGKYYIRAWNPEYQLVDNYQLSLSVRPIVVDKYEPDNTWEQATDILPFFEQDDHTIKAWGDVDYLKFTISDAPRTVYVDVYDSRSNYCSPFGVWLFDTDGTTQLNYNSTRGQRCGYSPLQQTITTNGTYFIKVAVPQNESGMRDNYTIKVTTDGIPPVVACDAGDRAALVALYNALNGANWNRKEGWLSDNVMNWQGVTLNAQGRVTKLNLTRNNLRGTIPPEIGNLTALRYLNLGQYTYCDIWGSWNQIQGNLPTSLVNLINLEVLSLDYLNLNTELPDIFTGMANLRELYLDQNNFTNAQLPQGILNCSKLEKLYLQYNNFSQLPNLTGFTYLQDVLVYWNRLTFEDIEPNLATYNFAYFDQAKIGQPLGLNPELGSTVLQTIEVGGENNLYQWYKDNQPIQGQTTNTLHIENVSSFDAGIYQLRITNTHATQLTLYSEPITLYQKELPIYKALEAFYISTGGPNWYNNTNWLSDTPLSSWYGIYQDQNNGQFRLEMYSNNLVGQLPANMGDLTLFNVISINDNSQLNGSIPESIGNLSQIQVLGIHNNSLSGEIPSSFGNLKNLSNLDLGNNQLSGSIPATITGCINLNNLYISNNRIENLPDLSEMSNLKDLYINNNRFQFDDLAPTRIGKPNLNFYYDPQAKFGQIEVYTRQTSDTLALTAKVGGTGNLYQWFKDGNLLVGKTANKLVFESLLLTDKGIYTCRVTNPNVPNLTLESMPYNVFVRIKPSFFLPDWTGVGNDVMKINIITASLDGIDLQYGDEIGIFDGPKCVGAAVVTETINQNHLLQIVVSADDGSGNGYTPGNTISYKVYDNSQDAEITGITSHYFNQNPLWSTDGKFKALATSYIELTGNSISDQTIILNSGWNIISANLIPANTNLKDLFQPIINARQLRKVMDERGMVIEDFGSFGGWRNNIGNWLPTEGYKVNVTQTTTLSIEGSPIQLPLAINLAPGWNIISYPSALHQNAMDIFQPLINEGKLKKVVNESGLALEDYGTFGGWKNNMGNLQPGKGYKVNVTIPCTVIIPEGGTKSAIILPEILASAYFQKVYTGNGIDHMNINLVELASGGLKLDDEIGIFDGKNCVGSARIGLDQMQGNQISISASCNDEMQDAANGFIPGHPITVKLYRDNEEYVLSAETINNTKSIFATGESMFAKVSINTTTGLKNLDSSIAIKCYPNPFSQLVNLDLNVPIKGELNVSIYNNVGQLVKILFDGNIEAEHLNLTWHRKGQDEQDVAPGIYPCKITFNQSTTIQKLIVR